MKKTCRVITCEYCDLDVYLNVKLFYGSAGYRVVKDKPLPDADLLVILRGSREISDHEYEGVVHAYDYVREYKINWKERFPKAKRIFVISPTPPECPDGVTYVKGYLPVIPELWQGTLNKKDSRPVHISHFKPMGEDRYQQDLLKLIKSGLVRAYGKKWGEAGIKAKPLSYRQVDRMFAASSCCYGLMYPYQRGKTLSGRMWQAPLKGCFVISEEGTNIASSPGVIEVSGLSADNLLAIKHRIEKCKALAVEAAGYWKTATQILADELGLKISPELISNRSISMCKKELFLQHISFIFSRIIKRIKRILGPRRILLAILQTVERPFRALQVRRMFKLTDKRPLYLVVETVNTCNAHCVFCCYGKTKIKPQVLPLDIFEKVIREYSEMGGGAVSLTPVPGEILLDPHLIKRYEILAKYKNIGQVSFTTNGIAFEKYSDEDLKYILRSSFMIQVSIGGLDREGYKNLYQVDQFENVLNSVSRLLDLKKTIGSDAHIHLSFRTNNPNFEEMHREQLEAFKRQGCLVSHISRYGNFGGIVNSGEVKNAQIIDGSGLAKNETCVYPLLAPSVLPNGLITNCGCVDVNGDSLIIGDTRHNSLRDCWISKERKKILNSFRQGKLVDLCKQCSLYRSCKHLAEPIYKNIRSYQKLPLEFYMLYGG